MSEQESFKDRFIKFAQRADVTNIFINEKDVEKVKDLLEEECEIRKFVYRIRGTYLGKDIYAYGDLIKEDRIACIPDAKKKDRDSENTSVIYDDGIINMIINGEKHTVTEDKFNKLKVLS